jgi:uncharacterized protein YbaA (DUF1428 family)
MTKKFAVEMWTYKTSWHAVSFWESKTAADAVVASLMKDCRLSRVVTSEETK